LKAGYEKQGDWGISVGYNQIPRVTPYLVNTGLRGIGTTSLTVAQPSIVPGSGTNYQLGTERDIVSLDFFKYFSPKLNLKVSFKNEDKDGTRHWGRGGQPEFAVEPIDSTTRQLEATLNYTDKDLQLSGGYYGSWYENANSLVDTLRAGDNPATLANHIYLSLPLDNEAHQVFLNGGYNFSPSTRGTFKVSYTHATQDEHLPTNDIAGLAWSGAPSSLNGEVNTTLMQLGLTARPLPRLNVVANLRYHNVEDETPANEIIHTVSGTTVTSVHATPLSYETVSGKLEGTYNLDTGLNLVMGIDRSNQDRTVPVGLLNAAGEDTERYVPFRSELDETTYRLQLRRTLSDTLNGSLAFLRSERDGSAYSMAMYSEPGEGIHEDSIDPINIADRTRNKWRANINWMPSERVDLQFNFESSKDDYSGHEYGLRDGSGRLFSVDAGFNLSPNWQLNTWLSHDQTKAFQTGWRQGSNNTATATGNAELERDAHLKDVGKSFGLGLKGAINGTLKVGADLQWTRITSSIDQAFSVLPSAPSAVTGATTNGTSVYAAGTVAAQLPDIESTMTRLNLFAEYTLDKNADLRFDVVHTRWKSDDWRSEERRVGKECRRLCRSRWSPYH
jgi:MtrB/PioB family decaheme-associated outer membrane protein